MAKSGKIDLLAIGETSVKRITSLLITLALALGISASMPATTSANSNCDPTATDGSRVQNSNTYYVTWNEIATGGNSILALGATLEHLHPWVDLPYGDKSWTFIGLFRTTTTGIFSIQVGFLAEINLALQYDLSFVIEEGFFPFSGQPLVEYHYWDPPAVDTFTDIQIGYNAAVKDFTIWASGPGFNIPGFVIGNGDNPFDPEWPGNPTEARIGNEIHSFDSQIRGGTGDYEDISAMRYGISGGAYINYGSSTNTTFDSDNSSPSNFGQFIHQPNQVTYNNSAQMDLFDKDCS
jgi:hypothetical protein